MLGGVEMRGVAAHAIAEGDPIPPEDRVSHARLSCELEQLYRLSAERMADHLGRHGASPDEQMDFVHEAFTRLLDRGSTRRSEISSAGAYLTRISRNLLHDRGRATRVRESWKDDLACRETGHHDQVVYLESRDRLRRLEAAVLKLKPMTREIFLARRLDGLSYAEIADLTGLSTKAVERHMSKAIAKVMRLMDRV